MDEAFNLACEEDTQEVFNACMNLVGHRDGGKTSLANRLMEKEFKQDVQSTEGVSMHLIKTTVKPNLLHGSMWNETSQDPYDLQKQFSHAVLMRAKQMSVKQEMKKSTSDSKQYKFIPVHKMVMHKGEYSESQAPIRNSQDHKWKPNVKSEVSVKEKYDTQEAKLNESTLKHEIKPTISKIMRNKILTHEHTLRNKQADTEIPLSIRLWDLGGQNEFLTTHHLFLNTYSTTLIVMDITKPIDQVLETSPKLGHPNTPAEVLHYWLNSLHAQASGKNEKPSIALILTHSDLIDVADYDRFTERYILDILNTIDGKMYGYLLSRENIYIVNNKSENNADFQKLRNQLISLLAQQNSWGHKMPVSWLQLKADIIERTQSRKHVPFSFVTNLAKQYRMSEKDVESFLNIQNIQGEFIFKPSPDLRNTVISDPQWLIDRYSSLITHHRFLDERNLTLATYHNLKHGYITENGLEELWEKDQIEFLKNLMTKYNLIVPLEYKQDTGQTYLIPSMVPACNFNMYDLSPFKDMKIVYSAVQSPNAGECFEVGIFHKLLSECSKTQNWKLCAEDHLSYTDVSFKIALEMRLALTLLKHDQLRSTIWCTGNALNKSVCDITLAIEDTRQIISSNMAKLKIAPGDTFKILCPHTQANDPYICLIKMRESMDPRTSELASHYMKNICALHGKVLQTTLPSLFTLDTGM